MSLLSSDTAKGMSDYLISGVHSYYDALSEAKEHNKSLALEARLQYLKNNGSKPIELREMTAELYRIAVICGVSDKELADFLNTQKDKVRYWRERYGIFSGLFPGRKDDVYQWRSSTNCRGIHYNNQKLGRKRCFKTR